MLPVLSNLSDKIVVLSECDTPMVLRPKGDAHEVIGPCFVEGLMKSEVATGNEQGRFRLETSSLY